MIKWADDCGLRSLDVGMAMHTIGRLWGMPVHCARQRFALPRLLATCAANSSQDMDGAGVHCAFEGRCRRPPLGSHAQVLSLRFERLTGRMIRFAYPVAAFHSDSTGLHPPTH